MKGLLLKEFYSMRRAMGVFFSLTMLIFLILGAMSDPSEKWFVLFYPPMFLGTLSANVMSRDELDRWDRYALTLPVSHTQLVCAKYISILALALAYGCLLVIFQSAGMALRNCFDSRLMFDIVINSVALMLSVSAVSLPMIFNLGVEKGCIFGMAGIALVFLISDKSAGDILENVLNNIYDPMPFHCSPVIAALLYVGSWLLSIQLYKKRELY